MSKRRPAPWIWAIVGAALLLSSLPAVVVAWLWAAFFSVGFKTSSTESMIHYNLQHPGLAAIAYGPLLLTAIAFAVGLLCSMVAYRGFRRDKRERGHVSEGDSRRERDAPRRNQ